MLMTKFLKLLIFSRSCLAAEKLAFQIVLWWPFVFLRDGLAVIDGCGDIVLRNPISARDGIETAPREAGGLTATASKVSRRLLRHPNTVPHAARTKRALTHVVFFVP